jgi:heme/copper-type cytochrome/quinol oxidase subunit 3
MSTQPASIDASVLPHTETGHRDLTWWGTITFMLAEGTTVAVCLASYFYLWRNFPQWPPERTPLPHLGAATANAVLLLVSLIPAAIAKRAADRMDESRAIRWFYVLTVLELIYLAVRVLEFRALGTRWDANAYGSIIWLTLGFHTSVVLSDAGDSIIQSAIFLAGRTEDKHIVGIGDNSLYWYFTVGLSLVVYAVVFLFPRVL